MDRKKRAHIRSKIHQKGRYIESRPKEKFNQSARSLLTGGGVRKKTFTNVTFQSDSVSHLHLLFVTSSYQLSCGLAEKMFNYFEMPHCDMPVNNGLWYQQICGWWWVVKWHEIMLLCHYLCWFRNLFLECLFLREKFSVQINHVKLSSSYWFCVSNLKYQGSIRLVLKGASMSCFFLQIQLLSHNCLFMVTNYFVQ